MDSTTNYSPRDEMLDSAVHYPLKNSANARWARRKLSASHNAVAFSDRSMLYMYDEDPSHADVKSFTPAESTSFKQGTMREALRIKRSLLATSREAERRGLTPSSWAELLDACDIKEEEILGLEHLVLQDPSKTIQRRGAHVRSVLVEQAKQREAGFVSDIRLARLSASLARKPALQARSRAARAA